MKAREEARSLGLKFYFTGRQCKHGHLSKRYVASGVCRECSREYYGKHRDERLAARNAYVRENREHVREVNTKHREANIESRRAAVKKAYRKNPGLWSAHSKKRKLDKINRTPPWANLDAIKFFYECRPKGCHVDHIIPLRGEFISGLHVETNLQWLPARANLRKKNKWRDSKA